MTGYKTKVTEKGKKAEGSELNLWRIFHETTIAASLDNPLLKIKLLQPLQQLLFTRCNHLHFRQ